MTLLASKALTAACGEGSESYALIHLYVIAYFGSLTDNDTRAVVDEEISADRRAGVDINTGKAVCVFGHDTRYERYFEQEKLVSYPVYEDSEKSGVGVDYLVLVVCRRVALE